MTLHDRLRYWAPSFPSPGAMLERLLNCLVTWQERSNQRHRLSELSDLMLKDIGVSRAEVERETRKPFWEA